MHTLHIPYSELAGSCSGLLFGTVPYTAHLTDPHHCTLTLSEKYLILASCRASPVPCILVPVGSSFCVEYRGQVCDVRVGKRIVVTDAL